MYIPRELFSTEIFWTGLKWLMIVGVWAFFAWGTWREDRRLKRRLHDKIDDNEAVNILRMLHKRDIQIWLQVSLLLIVMATNDIHRDAALLPVDFFVAPASVIPMETPKVEESPNDMYDKVLHKNAVENLPFSNITEFNEKNGKQEAYIDWLKERYESWLITYYYLQKCGKTAADDNDIIRRQLTADLTKAHAVASVEANILLAAAGSYKEMYSDIPCDTAHLAAAKSTYDANIQQARHVDASPATTNGSNAKTAAPR